LLKFKSSVNFHVEFDDIGFFESYIIIVLTPFKNLGEFIGCDSEKFSCLRKV